MELVPPLRFSCVEDGLYRGAYPLLRNFNHLRRLRLRTILSLIPEEPTKDLKQFCKAENIQLRVVQADRYKGEPQLLPTDLNEALSILLDYRHYPLLVHCLDGRQTTGMVVLALRKVMGWDYGCAYAEFLRFAKEHGNELPFIVDYQCDMEAPAMLPPWLWQAPVTYGPTDATGKDAADGASGLTSSAAGAPGGRPPSPDWLPGERPYRPPPLDLLLTDPATRARKHPLLRTRFTHQTAWEQQQQHQQRLQSRQQAAAAAGATSSASSQQGNATTAGTPSTNAAVTTPTGAGSGASSESARSLDAAATNSGKGRVVGGTGAGKEGSGSQRHGSEGSLGSPPPLPSPVAGDRPPTGATSPAFLAEGLTPLSPVHALYARTGRSYEFLNLSALEPLEATHSDAKCSAKADVVATETAFAAAEIHRPPDQRQCCEWRHHKPPAAAIPASQAGGTEHAEQAVDRDTSSVPSAGRSPSPNGDSSADAFGTVVGAANSSSMRRPASATSVDGLPGAVLDGLLSDTDRSVLTPVPDAEGAPQRREPPALAQAPPAAPQSRRPLFNPNAPTVRVPRHGYSAAAACCDHLGSRSRLHLPEGLCHLSLRITMLFPEAMRAAAEHNAERDRDRGFGAAAVAEAQRLLSARNALVGSCAKTDGASGVLTARAQVPPRMPAPQAPVAQAYTRLSVPHSPVANTVPCFRDAALRPSSSSGIAPQRGGTPESDTINHIPNFGGGSLSVSDTATTSFFLGQTGLDVQLQSGRFDAPPVLGPKRLVSDDSVGGTTSASPLPSLEAAMWEARAQEQSAVHCDAHERPVPVYYHLRHTAVHSRYFRNEECEDRLWQKRSASR